eukprot:TRINITY_DN8393_c0_g1_i3.p1 TRINITY_DN8393_c0_g1~~TRINITY_DN8393_c0_g1_i3.p1  ORF type:complete len:119 (-),score=18.50 TRINITY_DN8393_c0_g1_i3:256-612(-)
MIRHYTSASYDPIRNNLERTMVSDADMIAEQMRAQARQITQDYMSSPERLREMRELRTTPTSRGGGEEASAAPTTATTRTASIASTSQPAGGAVVRVPTPSEYTHTSSMRQRHSGGTH